MKDYIPIACELYDHLESCSVLKTVCDIESVDAKGKVSLVNSRIVDVFSKTGEEFIRLADGNLIRLDRIVSVNGKSFRASSDCKSS